MEDVTLDWPGMMTVNRAKKFLLTRGFVAVELYRTMKSELENVTADRARLRALLDRLVHCNEATITFCPTCKEAIKAELARGGKV